MNPVDLWSIVDKAGTVGCLILMVVSFSRGWVVPSYVVTDLREQIKAKQREIETWQAYALRSTDLAQQAVSNAPSLNKLAPRGD